MKITYKKDEGKVVAFNENYNTLNRSPSFRTAHAYQSTKILDSTMKSLKPILKPSSSVQKYERTRNAMGTAFVRKNSYTFTAQPPDYMLITQQP